MDITKYVEIKKQLTTREIVDKLYYEFNYVIVPRKLLSILRGNTEPDEKLKSILERLELQLAE